MKLRKSLQVALTSAGLLFAAALVFAGVKADRLARIGAGYKAKVACSEIFLAGRDAGAAIAGEFGGIDPMMDRLGVFVDEAARAVEAAGPFGLGRARAVYREGYGCTLANGGRIRPLPRSGSAGARRALADSAAGFRRGAVLCRLRRARLRADASL